MAEFWWEVSLGDHEEEENNVTPELRNRVFQRDGWQCQYCGEEGLEKLTVHHVRFRSQGGAHKVSNLVTLCGHCHMRIHRRSLWVKRINNHWYFHDKQVTRDLGDPNAKAGIVTLALDRLRRYFRRGLDGQSDPPEL